MKAPHLADRATCWGGGEAGQNQELPLRKTHPPSSNKKRPDLLIVCTAPIDVARLPKGANPVRIYSLAYELSMRQTTGNDAVDACAHSC